MDGYFEMTKQEMMSTVYRQLALDYNCQPEDFTRSGILFTEAKMQRGRREMPFVTPRLEVITMGKSTVVNASKSVMPYVKQKFRNKSSYEILTDKLVNGANPYYLPDIEHIKPMENDACSFVLLDKDLHGLYKNKGFSNALQYDRDSARPEVLAAVAYDQKQIVGIACVSADSQTMWQIGVDVRPAYRGNSIGVKLVNMLTIETLARGVVPYYTTDIANISSQKVAVKSGYLPAWTHCFRNRLPKFHKLKAVHRAAFYFTVGGTKIAAFLIKPVAFLKFGRYARGIVRLCAGQREPNIDNRRRLWYSEVAAFFKMREISRTEKAKSKQEIQAAVCNISVLAPHGHTNRKRQPNRLHFCSGAVRYRSKKCKRLFYNSAPATSCGDLPMTLCSN